MSTVNFLVDGQQLTRSDVLTASDQGLVVDTKEGAVIAAVSEPVAQIEAEPAPAQLLPLGTAALWCLRLAEDASVILVVAGQQVQHNGPQPLTAPAFDGSQIVQQGKGNTGLQPQQGIARQFISIIQAKGLILLLSHQVQHGL